ncbi:DUF3850 domain-containing protein [Cytobacillus sp. FJAT-54145]|uniref:DUF3850 domain-containing protein n=1 Tax=Cytobacillus spartinae TaxID=3299023 RepID=A0ABW6KEL4_9BACI
MRTIHELKTWPEAYSALVHANLYKRKTVDLRKNDRDFKVGDVLFLREFEPEEARYTGRNTYRIVTHIVDAEEFVAENFVAMSILPIPENQIKDILEPFDQESDIRFDVHAYKAMEIAEGTAEPTFVKGYTMKTMPSVESIREMVQQAGFDTFEITVTNETVKRYYVDEL